MLPENENPISDLMDDLGMQEPTTTDDGSKNENDLSDSDTSTQTDDDKSETTAATETPEGDTDTTDAETLLKRVEELEAEKAITDKRIKDKDKFINELQQGKSKEGQDENEELGNESGDADAITDDTDFWDDPEGKYKSMMQQMDETNAKLEATNLRVDENIYSQSVPDYYGVVKQENIQEAQQNDPEFVTQLQAADNKFEFAYKYLKGRVEAKTNENDTLREQIRAEERAKLLKGADANKDNDIPPSITNLGSGGSEQKASSDGFESVFGG